MTEQNDAFPRPTSSAETGSIDWFIERYAAFAEEDGFPRTGGRILALLLVSSEPLSFSDIAVRLQVSRGGVSTNLRLLQGAGLVERVTKAGDRQDYYQFPDNPWVALTDRQSRRLQTFRHYAELLVAANPNMAESTRRRIGGLLWVLSESIAMHQDLSARFADRR